MSIKDEGKTEVALTTDRGRIVLRFPEPRQWVAFDPENAVVLAEAMAKSAYLVRMGPLANPQSAPRMTEQIRARLVNTVALMIASMNREGRAPKVMAEQVVDQILARVT